MSPEFERFITERRYLHNVTPATVLWYRQSLFYLPCEAPTQDQLKDTVMRMRAAGRNASGCNCAIRCLNAYLRWSGSPLKIAKLKEAQTVPATFSAEQVKRLVKWKPRSPYQRRLHLLVLLLFDTGARISEALGLRVKDVDLDNLLVTLDGKGRKQRTVPISNETRKAVFRYTVDHHRKADALLFASRHETAVSAHSAYRDVKLLCKRLGFEPHARTLHAFRHTFALGYVRAVVPCSICNGASVTHRWTWCAVT